MDPGVLFASVLPFVRGWPCRRTIGWEEEQLLHACFAVWQVWHPLVTRPMLREMIEEAACWRAENEYKDWMFDPRPFPANFSAY